MAQTGAVYCDDMVIPRQPITQAKGEIAQIAAGTVDQHQVGAASLLQQMHALPLDHDELAHRRGIRQCARLTRGNAPCCGPDTKTQKGKASGQCLEGHRVSIGKFR